MSEDKKVINDNEEVKIEPTTNEDIVVENTKVESEEIENNEGTLVENNNE